MREPTREEWASWRDAFDRPEREARKRAEEVERGNRFVEILRNAGNAQPLPVNFYSMHQSGIGLLL